MNRRKVIAINEGRLLDYAATKVRKGETYCKVCRKTGFAFLYDREKSYVTYLCEDHFNEERDQQANPGILVDR